MIEYLAAHNVTIVTFVIFVVLWLMTAFFYGFGVYILIKNVKKMKTDPIADGVATYTLFALIAFSVTFGPVMVCGFWHFLNMVLTLCFGFNLY